MNPIMIMYRLNSLLTRRMKRFPFFYGGAIFAAMIFLIIFCGMPLFTTVVEFADIDEIRSYYNASCYLLVCLDCLFVCIRVSSDTIIDLTHLTLFPISRFVRINLNVIIALCDYRILLYAGCTVIMVSNCLQHGQIGATLIALLLMAILYLTVTIWMTAGVNLAGELIRKNRANIFMLFASLILLFNISLIMKAVPLLKYFPATSSAGNGLFMLDRGETSGALLNLLALLLTAVIGQLFLYFSPQRQ